MPPFSLVSPGTFSGGGQGSDRRRRWVLSLAWCLVFCRFRASAGWGNFLGSGLVGGGVLRTGIASLKPA